MNGQSNMEFSVANDFDRANIIATAGEHAAGLRMFAVQKNASREDGGGTSRGNRDVIDVQQGGWVPSTTANVCGSEYDANKTSFCEAHCGPSAHVKSYARNTWGYFSAVCYLHGRALWKATGRPQGLLESCWGGQTIESFSSAEASAACGASPAKAGDHFTAMIQPLLNFSIKGAVWCECRLPSFLPLRRVLSTTATFCHSHCPLTRLPRLLQIKASPTRSAPTPTRAR